MSVAEVVVEGLFRLATTALGIGALLLFLPALVRLMSKHVGGKWGQPEGSLPAFSLKRLTCKHRVAYYGPGTHGLWAMWCESCGKKTGGR